MIEQLFLCFQNLNKDPAESRWRPGSQARVNKAGHWNYSSQHVSHGEPIIVAFGRLSSYCKLCSIL